MKTTLMLCLLGLSCFSHATPAFTLYNQAGMEQTHDIKVRIYNLDGVLCYENNNISQYRYRTQVDPTELTCEKHDDFMLYVDFAYSKHYQYSHKLKNQSECAIQHDRDRYGPILTLLCQ